MFNTIILRSVVILVSSLFWFKNVDKPGNTGVINISIKGCMTNYMKSRYVAVLNY